MSAAPACVLGFDYGTRCIGVAVGERVTASARALKTVAARGGEPEWPHLDALIGTWQPAALVVGLPLTHDGGEQAVSRGARRFAERLGERYGLPVHLADERHTSQEAARRFADARAAGLSRRRDAHSLDAVAAAVILETWLSESA